jgi:hypothetical protein
MDETKLRAVIREEITLAVQTLADQMYDSDPESTGVSFGQAARYFADYAYRGACEAADAERAENPFEEKTPDAVTEALRDVLASLREREADPAHIAQVEQLVKDRAGSND